jgi:hypothetical protein
VSPAGDINGDGHPDVFIGAPYLNVNDNSAQGRAFVFSGVDGSLLLTLDNPGLQGSALFGFALAVPGDLNSDGYPDLLVGASFQDVDGVVDRGQAFVFSGVDGTLLLTLNNPIPQDVALFGSSVAAIGDINGDGLADFVVGAPAQDVGEKTNQGQAFVFSGVDGTLLFTIDDPLSQAGALFASRVVAAGDINGDGVPDIAASSPNRSIGLKIGQGQVFVFSGVDGTLLLTIDPPTPQPLATFGLGLAGAADISGDGIPDLLIGAPFQNVGEEAIQGQAFVFSGADGALLLVLNDPAPEAAATFGHSLAASGDVDGDSISDILVGAINQNVDGVVNQGRAFVFSGTDGSLLFTLDNPIPHMFALFGGVVAAPGDINQDGLPDFLVGSPGQNVSQANQGQAFVFSGADGSPLLTLDNPFP